MTRRLHADDVAVGLSIAGIAVGAALAARGVIDLAWAAIDRSVRLPVGGPQTSRSGGPVPAAGPAPHTLARKAIR